MKAVISQFVIDDKNYEFLQSDFYTYDILYIRELYSHIMICYMVKKQFIFIL